MKTTTLAVGLLQAFGAVGFAYWGFHSESVWLSLLWAVGGAVNGFFGVQNVMEALFGDEGLICDLTRYWDRSTARADRAAGPRGRGLRLSHPSPALQQRGAERRLRNTRR